MLALDWELPPGIAATVTTVTAPGNLAAHVNADPAEVVRQRRELVRQHQLPSSPRWLRQIHSQRVVDYADAYPTVEADAIYSSAPKSVCAVLTADCLPILFCSDDGIEIAAVHAGWRGLVNGVVENTLAQFTAPAERIRAFIGPAISNRAFEVGADVYQCFADRGLVDTMTFKPFSEQKWLADLPLLAKYVLHQQSCDAVTLSHCCTYSESQWFSYRRDANCGRIASLIWKK